MQWNRKCSGILSLAQGWRLAQAWHGDRPSANWRPMPLDEAQAAFAKIGLHGPFWRLKRE